MIHPLSDCKNNHIPESTNIWQYCVVLPDARIGENCNICSHCLIENKVKIGDNCTIKRRRKYRESTEKIQKKIRKDRRD